MSNSWGAVNNYSSNFTYPAFLNDIKLKSNTLAQGLARSYGDSCLNDNGNIISTKYLNRFINFNIENQTLEAESGTSFEQILNLIIPSGLFIPVTPGTKFITLGGAIANDIHGKNHHSAATFGNHVLSLTLLTSNGIVECSGKENKELFYATIGGLGLTGLILKAKFKLIKIESSQIIEDLIKFHSLQEFLDLTKESDKDFKYTVSWVDCINAKEIRGIFMRGNFAKDQNFSLSKKRKITIPFNFPKRSLNPITTKVFNHLYYGKLLKNKYNHKNNYDTFFYPLDSINNWNRIYGKAGFYQHQSIIPYESSLDAFNELFSVIKKSKQASFLAVLKVFGEKKSKGMLSFPRPGITLALDFPNLGEKTLSLLKTLDKITLEAGGKLYPAKDNHMSLESFHKSYPSFSEFEKYIDPSFSSSFIRRVTT